MNRKGPQRHHLIFYSTKPCYCHPSVQLQWVMQFSGRGTHAGLPTWDVVCTGWSRGITMAAQCSCRMTTCFSALLFVSAEAVCGVRRRQRSFHQVADGERPGLDHLLCGRGELQGGCKHHFFIFFMLYTCFRSNCVLYFGTKSVFLLMLD